MLYSWLNGIGRRIQNHPILLLTEVLKYVIGNVHFAAVVGKLLHIAVVPMVVVALSAPE